VTKAIVGRTFLAIGQDGVRLAAFFEFFFGVRIVGVAVGMEL